MFVVKGGKTPLLLIDRPIKQADDRDLKQKQNLLNHRFFLSELTCQSNENFVLRCTFITSNSIVLASSPTFIDDYLQLQTNLRTSKSFQDI